MSKLITFLKEMSNLRTRKAKAMSRKPKCTGEDIVLRLPSGIALRMPPGSVLRTKSGQ